MKKTKISTAGKTKKFTLPSGREIYDRIMKRIEPELVTANLKKLDTPYRKESKAARRKRYTRYAKAFKAYRTQYKAWILNLRTAVAAYRRAVSKAAQKLNKGKEDAALKALEAKMSAA